MSKTNAIIIGGGTAGLTCAAYLTRAGLRTQIFEAHSQAGGYISAFSRKGYTFPAGPTSFGSNGIIFPILQELGLDGEIRFARCAHQLSWDGQDVPLLNAHQVRDDLGACFPQEKRALAGYFGWVAAGTQGLGDLMNSGLMFGRNPTRAILGTALRHPRFLWAGARANRSTNRSLHAQYFQAGLLRDMLDRQGYPVMSGQTTLGMWISYFNDTWVPLGGMAAFSQPLTALVERQGGEINLNQRVTRIRVKDGRACGVELSDGSFHAADWVISAADLRHTCMDLFERKQLSPHLIEKLEKARPSESIFTVYLGLRSSPQLEASLKRFRQSHMSFTCADGQAIELALLSRDDPALAPQGKHALYIGKFSPYEEWETLKGKTKTYQAHKTACADALIARAEEFLPGLSACIEVREAASPLTFERFTGNWRGSTAGWNWDPQLIPHIDLKKDLPVENFYAIGHYTFSPGGVPTAMITAWYIARAILKAEKERGDELR